MMSRRKFIAGMIATPVALSIGGPVFSGIDMASAPSRTAIGFYYEGRWLAVVEFPELECVPLMINDSGMVLDG